MMKKAKALYSPVIILILCILLVTGLTACGSTKTTVIEGDNQTIDTDQDDTSEEMTEEATDTESIKSQDSDSENQEDQENLDGQDSGASGQGHQGGPDQDQSGAPGGNPGENQGGGPGGNPGGSPGGQDSTTIDHGDYVELLTEDVEGTSYTSDGDSENAVRIQDGSEVTLDSVTVNKSGGDTSSGNDSNFYGVNAGILAMDEANVTINNSDIRTDASGGNGVFSYGDGTQVTVNDSTITTEQDNSGGVMVTGGGTMYVNNTTIETSGNSAAALRTDRGGGTLVVDGGSYTSHGTGSPAIYCTADITASNATLRATNSEAVVIEGKNSVTLNDDDVQATMETDDESDIHSIMIYQSMSGDSEEGESNFSMNGGTLTVDEGDTFYVTNTTCEINMTDVDLISSNDILLRVVGNDSDRGWGQEGANGGTCTFNADGQTLSGKIVIDEISSLDINLENGTTFEGSMDSEQEGGVINVSISSDSQWTLTGDSYITSFDGDIDQINLNGYKLYVDGEEIDA